MSNWCENKLKIGNPSKIAEFEQKYLTQTDDVWNFDFNSVLPRPKSLDEITVFGWPDGKKEMYQLLSQFEFDNEADKLFRRGLLTFNGRKVADNFVGDNSEVVEKAKAFVESSLNCTKGRERLLQAFLEVFNEIVYGKSDWYQWSIENWGCKWSCAHFSMGITLGEYFFDTAWAPPLALIEELSVRHPEYQISGAYSEPGADFAGKYTADDNGYLLDAEFEVREIMKSEFGYSDDDFEDWVN